MTSYDHAQPASTIRGGLGAGAVLTSILLLVALFDSHAAPAYALVLALSLLVLIACIVMFHQLRVTVADGLVTVAFGLGWPRRRIPLADIRSVRAERNSWWWGYGIRMTPKGWMFNASGLDAVQLELTGNRRFRIGTDDPVALVAAIEKSAGLSRSGNPPA